MGVDQDDIETFYLGNTSGEMIENDTYLAPKLSSYVDLASVPAKRFEDTCTRPRHSATVGSR